MRIGRKTSAVLVMLVLILSGLVGLMDIALAEGTDSGESRATFYEGATDETQSFTNAKRVNSGDVYYGHVDRVNDKSDYFQLDAAFRDIINVHVYIIGHDGGTEWRPYPGGTPPPPAGYPSAMFRLYLLTSVDMSMPLDGDPFYPFIRHLCVNICAPVPGTVTYLINVSIDWFMSNNPFVWDYFVEFDLSQAQPLSSGQVVSNTIDIDTRDTHWYRINARNEEAVNGSFEIRNFNSGDPTERDINIWLFPDTIGGYPFSYPWDWSAAPNEPIEPISVLATYDGEYYIKLRGMNNTNNLPCAYRLEMYTHSIPDFPLEAGLQNVYFNRFRHDTDWYKFTMKYNLPKTGEPGLWNERFMFNLTERADAEDLPDFDLYVFGRQPNAKYLDLLDSSFRNDHPTFYDIERDPNKNTEEVRCAAYYNGTYYLEVNDWNNTGYYDVRWEKWAPTLSDNDNLPFEAKEARAGVYESHIHQAFDHYDWYKVEADHYVRFQFDSFKPTDMFNASLYRFDASKDEYVLVKGGWNTLFNFTTQNDELHNLIDVSVNLEALGLGRGTYFICVYAAIGAEMATDPNPPNRQFVYKNENDAEADYELRVWIDDAPPFNRAPQVIKAIPDLVVDEDTDKLDYLNLYDFFRDTDVGDSVLRFKVSLLSGKLKKLILADDMVGFQAWPDYSGKAVVKVRAQDRKYLETSLTWNITFLQLNDPPYAKGWNPAEGPYAYYMPEDSLRQLDFKNIVYDVDAGDSFTITVPANPYMSVTLDPQTLVADVTGAPNWAGEVVVTFVATDESGAQTNIPVKFVVQNIEDNPLIIKPIGDVEILEDTTTTMDLKDFFEDPDTGDSLTFVLSSNLNIAYSIDPATSVITLVPDHDYYGFREIWVTAIDTTGRTAQQRFNMIVVPKPDAPVIDNWSPRDLNQTVKEEAALSFVVLNVSDPEFGVLIYNWYLDGKMVGPSNFFNYKPIYSDQGTHELKVVVTDEEGMSDELTWTVTVTDVPRPPEGGVSSPANNAKFYTDEKVPFFAFFYDLDGDAIEYRWYIDGKQESTATSFNKKLGEGKHEVRLEVSAGDHTVPRFLNITVDPRDEPGFEAPIVVGAMAVGFMAAAVWGDRRRK